MTDDRRPADRPGPSANAMGTGRPQERRDDLFRDPQGGSGAAGGPSGAEEPRGTPGAGGTGGPGAAADVQGAGGPAAPNPGAGGAQGGAGPGVGGSLGGTTGTSGYGSSATGHPGAAAAGDVGGRDMPVSREDRARGVVEQRVVSVAGNNAAARDAQGLGSGAGSSDMTGKYGSGSTTGVPGGNPNAISGGEGMVGQGLGVEGPTPQASPVADAGVVGAGARDEATARGERGTGTPEGRAMAEHNKRMGAGLTGASPEEDPASRRGR
ncbi:MAG TPA: hypothetical protein VEB20_13200 [Azospirillaceae bacterium]|nr:hypothetical protein [Azospirillaceae bacterium]